jgi:flagellar hook protein FlgE
MTQLSLWAGKLWTRSAEFADSMFMFNHLCTAVLLVGCLLPPSIGAMLVTNTPPFNPNFLAILGSGYFVVREPDENILYVTRRGDFQFDANGYLITSRGFRVQGFSNPALTEIGDLRIDAYADLLNSDPCACVGGYRFQSDGRLLVGSIYGTEYVRGQVLLQRFDYPSKMRNMGYGYYALEQSAMPLPQPLPPETSGLGALAPGQVEAPVPFLELTQLKAQVPPSSQGVLYSTGSPTDMAIEGRGFFVLRDATTNVFYATRAGAFYTDPDGYLVNYAGMRVQGYTNGALTGIGDIQLDRIGLPPNGDPSAAEVIRYSINYFGKIKALWADGTEYVRGQILVRDCAASTVLVRTNFGLYPLVEASGLWTGMTAPGYGGLGWVFSGMAEVSQFDADILSVRSNLNLFIPGAFHPTESATDLAICGLGLFIVRDPISNLQYATRCGAFHLDANGYLVTSNGFRVQGFTNTALTLPGDLVINPAGAWTNSTFPGFYIDFDGSITIVFSDGSSITPGQILLQWFQNPQALRMGANQLYSNLEGALPIFTNGAPGRHGLGWVRPGLEDLRQPGLQMPPQSGFRLLVSDIPGGSVVEASGDCVHWTPLGQINDSGIGETEFFDTNVIQVPCRFYRVCTPPDPGSAAPVGTTVQ